MAKRINVSKLRGIYYNNDKDSYVEREDLSTIKKSISEEINDLAVEGFDNIEDIDGTIIRYIQSMSIRNYNNLLDADSKKLSMSEIPDNLLKIYAAFSHFTSLSNVVLIYCDYFSLKYEMAIKELPNGAKLKLYEELSKYTINKELLNELLVIDNKWPRLF